MKIVIAPQAFKGTLSAGRAADAMVEAALAVYPHADVVRCPVADGGDGTLDALIEATGGAYHNVETTGPLGEPVVARWGSLGDGHTAVVETAQACGLALLPFNVRDPLRATTYGVGAIIRAALDAGYRRIILGIGGSATNDGGAGLAASLGVRLLQEDGSPMPPGGAGLLGLAGIDASELDPRLREAELVIATDVTNVLCGPAGASATFGPQKGASLDDVAIWTVPWDAWPTLCAATLALTCRALPAVAQPEAWAPAWWLSLAHASPGAPTSSPKPWGSTRV